MQNQRLRYLQAMGIQPWELKVVDSKPTNETRVILVGENLTANSLLTAMLHSVDVNSDQIKLVDDITKLDKEIALAKPNLIIGLGPESIQILKIDNTFETVRNKIHSYSEKNIPLIFTYHPDYLMKNPKDKGKAYQDLLSSRNLLSL